MSRREDKMIDYALSAWADWLLAYFLPPPERTKRIMQLCAGWDEKSRSFIPEIRAPGTHSNPVLARLESAESHGTSWPMSIHGIISDMHRTHKIALIARAFDRSREAAARLAGIKVESMVVAESIALSQFRISLAVIAHVMRGQDQQRKEDREAADMQIKVA